MPDKPTVDDPADPYPTATPSPAPPARYWPSTDKLKPGDQVAGYVIRDELGEGGMGVVYRAHDPTLKRDVALKMILDHGSLSAQEQSRFLQEAQVIAQLQHPHIVQIFASGSADGRPYFVMEFIAGGSLTRRLERKPQPPLPAARLVMLLARTVQASHEKNILHRDLKPSNILLAPVHAEMPGLNTVWGCPKIADFGLAKRLDQGPALTASGAALGTPVYMAPEQVRGRHADIGFPTDVYGLGGILYELLVGRPAFFGETAFEVMDRVVNQPPDAPGRRGPRSPRSWSRSA